MYVYMSTGRSTYFVEKNVKTIQAEIMKHGPVEAVMDVYYCLFPYESGNKSY